jgi:DNA-directed RNA polymerase specialized sigma24 family protein
VARTEDFEALRPELLRLARALLRGSRVRLEPEDLVQTVLLRIHAAAAAGKLAADSPRHFAFAALRNLFLDEVRRHSHQRELHDDKAGADRPDLRGHGASAVEVADLLGRLEPHERRFLELVVFEEMGVGEAQAAAGWPPKSPYYHLRLLLERLARLMEER